MELAGANLGLSEIARQKTVLGETMIKLGVDGKVETRAIGLDPAHNLLHVLEGTLPVPQSDKGLGEDRGAKEKGERIFFENGGVDVVTKVARAFKIHEATGGAMPAA